MKLSLKLSIVPALIVGLVYLGESLLQPKIRVVPFEDVPITATAPDVTFMNGVSMDPPVQTNPFLVIFSPIETLAKRIRVVPGSLNALTDSTSIFVWDVIGIRSVWHLDRRSLELDPLFLRSDQRRAHVCSRIFPTTSWAIHRPPFSEIRRSPNPGNIAAQWDTSWIEMEVNPVLQTIRPVGVP